MRLAVTVIAAERERTNLPRHAAAVATRLATEPLWLGPAACDFVLAAQDPVAVEAEVRTALHNAAVDVLVQRAAGRRKRLLVADLEATVIENEMLDELADLIGLYPRIAEITRRAMNGEIDFVAALERRVALLAGVEEGMLAAAAARIRIAGGAASLVATMRRDGAVTALVSGGFTVFAEPVAKALGFDHVIANRLEVVSGRVLGSVRPPLVTPEAKREALLALAAAHAVPLAETLAVGDGANDLPLLRTAGLGVAFHAKPRVAAAAGFRLDHADLCGLLYAQGYRQQDFVA
ncbi:MAG TPA: phosphoserine phosphatase SerB [Stellaceae bacterium]|nr:phosphoserine phosphatase SerB [Stellaceae bacterium]